MTRAPWQAYDLISEYRALERWHVERRGSYEDQFSGRDGGREPAHLVQEYRRRRRQRCMSRKGSGVVSKLVSSAV